MRRLLAVSRWSRVVIGILVLGTLIAACSVLLDRNKNQCNSDKDCLAFGGHPACQDNVCVETGLGPPGCVVGPPMTSSDFANQCSTATCQPFDNCANLGMCSPTSALPGTIPPAALPPPPDAAPVSTVDAAAPPQMIDCVDPASRNTVVVGGSTAIQPFLRTLAPLLAANSPPYQIAYQPTGSCSGADNMFDPTKRVIKDVPGKQALLYHTDGSFEPCTFANGNGTGNPLTLDVEASDVYASSCNMNYAPGGSSSIAEYLALIQPMTFVVPASAKTHTISAEMAHFVFGRGSEGAALSPFTDQTLFFIRNSGSGTQQMISRAITIDAKSWWGIDRGGSSQVLNGLKTVDPTKIDKAIGILSTDFADSARDQVRILSFQATGQLCGYFPDSTEFARDKRNVRDGHYAIWGPEHFFAVTNGNLPNDAAAAFLTRFSGSRIDTPLLDAIITSGLVPSCAMKVQRTSEMGEIIPYTPPFQCGCYFESKVPNGPTVPDGCQVCAGPADCPTSKPSCNLGFCEAQ